MTSSASVNVRVCVCVYTSVSASTHQLEPHIVAALCVDDIFL